MTEPSIGIGEFAFQTRLSVSAVRFYCDRGLLTPGFVDPLNGYRRFFASQIADAELVRDLRTMGLSLDHVAEAKRMAPPDRTDMIRAHLEELENAAANARGVAAKIGISQSRKQVEPTVISTEAFRQAICQIVPSTGTDLLAPHLMCVLLEVRENSLRLVGTDSYRLSIRDCVPIGAGSDFAVVLAAAKLTEWVGALGNSQAEEIELSVNEHGDLTALGDGVSISAERLPIEFPAYEQVLSRQRLPTSQLACDCAEFVGALNRFGGTEPLRFHVANQRLHLSRGSASESLAAQTTGLPLETWVNPEFATSAAKHALGPEIVIEATSSDAPLLFRSADSGTYTSLLMPVLV